MKAVDKRSIHEARSFSRVFFYEVEIGQREGVGRYCQKQGKGYTHQNANYRRSDGIFISR